jgi:hypothetical protein
VTFFPFLKGKKGFERIKTPSLTFEDRAGENHQCKSQLQEAV